MLLNLENFQALLLQYPVLYPASCFQTSGDTQELPSIQLSWISTHQSGDHLHLLGKPSPLHFQQATQLDLQTPQYCLLIYSPQISFASSTHLCLHRSGGSQESHQSHRKSAVKISLAQSSTKQEMGINQLG
jgi:hypothetical protein